MTVEASTTRLPTEPPYNTFTILCTASAPDGVIAAKTIIWRRKIGSGTTGLTDVTANGAILIEPRDLTQAESTSLLTVTEDTAGDYRYRCRVDISELGIAKVNKDVYPINVIGMFLYISRLVSHFPCLVLITTGYVSLSLTLTLTTL